MLETFITKPQLPLLDRLLVYTGYLLMIITPILLILLYYRLMVFLKVMIKYYKNKLDKE